MKLTKSGKRILKHFEKVYKTAEKAKEIFEAMVEEKKKGTEKWVVKEKEEK